MDKPFGKYALVGLALVVVGFLENTFFGADSGGAKHDISVLFFFLAVIGLVVAVVCGILALVARPRRSAARR